MLSRRANIMSMSMGKALILTVLLVLSLCVLGSTAQDISSLLSAIKQQTSTSGGSDSSLTAEEIKKVYDEKRKNLETLRKTEVSLLAVEEAIRKYGSNNLLYKQRLEKLNEIAAVKRVLQNEVASLMFLCEEKKCNAVKPKEEPKQTVQLAPAVPPTVTAPQPAVLGQQVVSSVPMATMTIGPIPLDGDRPHRKRSAPPAMKKDDFIDRKQQEEEIEQIFKPPVSTLSFGEDFPGFDEPPMPEEPSIPEPSIPETGFGKKKVSGAVWPFEEQEDEIVKYSSPTTESGQTPRKSKKEIRKPTKKSVQKRRGKKDYAKPVQNNLLNLLKNKKNGKKKFTRKSSGGKKKSSGKKDLSPKSAGKKSARGKQVKTKSTETAQKKTKSAKRNGKAKN
ncbi:predicted protein [Naegleria gruberi]|uniref:Predicted protein n=1 Tax=Naegleria gruberi TaxID=5762 RepID=D2UYJ0_NAEGR|nr:uncharacterized protein NAEGRDRAFT_45188 [Naegleria gruberi]EFC50482.1 predicted protein [Naegleria gruberi]|eukprot:XP_002683226.1 predicted protein [Naegleria gruberi strain NEG-M]